MFVGSSDGDDTSHKIRNKSTGKFRGSYGGGKGEGHETEYMHDGRFETLREQRPSLSLLPTAKSPARLGGEE